MAKYNYLDKEVVGQILGMDVIPVHVALRELAILEAECQDTIDDHDCKANISFDDALDIVQSTDDWSKEIDPDSVDIHTIVDMITFQNSHEVAYLLSNGPNPEIATALLEELLYYRINNII